jgi:hemolysin III
MSDNRATMQVHPNHRSPSAFPVYSLGERRADLCIHIAGVVFGIAGSFVLLLFGALDGDAALLLSLAAYGLGLVAMLFASALYNLAGQPARKELLRRIDHAAIFVMIASSYTPFLVNIIGGNLGHGLLIFVWLAAAAGVALKLLLPRRFERLSVLLYLLLGWTVLVFVGRLIEELATPGVVLLAVGGVLYSIGVLFHLARRLPYHNAVWHGMVLAAAACHFVAVLGWVALPGT